MKDLDLHASVRVLPDDLFPNRGNLVEDVVVRLDHFLGPDDAVLGSAVGVGGQVADVAHRRHFAESGLARERELLDARFRQLIVEVDRDVAERKDQGQHETSKGEEGPLLWRIERPASRSRERRRSGSRERSLDDDGFAVGSDAVLLDHGLIRWIPTCLSEQRERTAEEEAAFNWPRLGRELLPHHSAYHASEYSQQCFLNRPASSRLASPCRSTAIRRVMSVVFPVVAAISSSLSHSHPNHLGKS